MSYVKSQAGVISLLTSIIVSLLLVVITTSAIALMTSELRQASDYDQSVKAYFAAEAGIEDALAAIRRATAAGDPIPVDDLDDGVADDCDALDPADASLGPNIEYTCQILALESNQITGELKAEESVQLDFTGLNLAGHQVIVEWNQRDSTPTPASDPQQLSGIPVFFPPNTDTNSPQYWPGRYPAVMETTFISYPAGDINSPNQITHNVTVLKPVSGPPLLPPVNPAFDINWNSSAKPTNVNCGDVADGQYTCVASFNNFNPDSFVLRLQPRYSRAHYRVRVVRTNSTQTVTVPRGQITIDVTGRAGDVFRRVIFKIPISPQPQPNQIVIANDSICKVLEVSRIRNAANDENACPFY